MLETENALANLRALLEGFVRGDQTTEQVREMDKVLNEAFSGGAHFPDQDAYDELEVAVACFKPGGGQFMYNDAQMTIVCRYVLARLGKTNL